MYQRIYFNPDGSVKAHLFRVFNDSVSDEKAEEFSDLLQEFGKTARINTARKEPFAQCGKISYANKN
jgi:hypothetical protein